MVLQSILTLERSVFTLCSFNNLRNEFISGNSSSLNKTQKLQVSLEEDNVVQLLLSGMCSDEVEAVTSKAVLFSVQAGVEICKGGSATEEVLQEFV